MATRPTVPERVAVVYQHRGPGAACRLNPTVRISHDARPDLAVDEAEPGRPVGPWREPSRRDRVGTGSGRREPPVLGEYDGAVLWR